MQFWGTQFWGTQFWGTLLWCAQRAHVYLRETASPHLIENEPIPQIH